MKNPLEMTMEELKDHIERRKRVIASEMAKPKWQRDEGYIQALIAKQRMWIAILESKRQEIQGSLF